MAATNQPNTTAPAQQAPGGGSSFVTSKDGTKIAYNTAGAGATLIYVPGAMGFRASPWMRAYEKALAEKFHVVVYDRRGRGESGDTQPFAVQREIEDIEALIKAVGPSHVFGMSSGAALLLEAEASGVPMLSAIAFEPPYMVGEHKKPAHTDYEQNVKALIAQGKRDEALTLFMRVVGVPGWMLGIMKILPMWKKMRPVAHTLAYDAAIMNGFDIPTKRLSSVRVPTLLVYGEKTPQALQDGTRAVSKVVPGAELRSIPKQSHNLKAASILPMLVEFTAKHEAGAKRGLNGAALPRVAAPVATRSS
jgi:pimeloyl-ACP methyl ester carboxylesterase